MFYRERKRKKNTTRKEIFFTSHVGLVGGYLERGSEVFWGFPGEEKERAGRTLGEGELVLQGIKRSVGQHPKVLSANTIYYVKTNMCDLLCQHEYVYFICVRS